MQSPIQADDAHSNQVDLLWMCNPDSVDDILVTLLQMEVDRSGSVASSFLFHLSSDEVAPMGGVSSDDAAAMVAGSGGVQTGVIDGQNQRVVAATLEAPPGPSGR